MSINRIKLANLFAMAFLGPFLVALLALGVWIKALQFERQESRQAGDIVLLVDKYDRLMERISTERGRTLGFISAADANIAVLGQARRKLDEEIVEVRAISPNMFPAVAPEVVNESRETVLAGLSSLTGVRSQVDERAGSDGFDYYTNLNSVNLNVIRRIGILIANEELRQNFEVKLTVTQVKELFGQVRGLLNGVFVRGGTSHDGFTRIVGLIQQKEALLNRFERLASNELVQQLNSMSTRHHWQQVNRVLQQFQATQNAGSVESPSHWFELVSRNISDIDTLMTSVNDQIQDVLSNKAATAQLTSLLV